MNQEWSLLNKTFQAQLGKEATFKQGIGTLLKLRQELMDELLGMRPRLNFGDFSLMPFPKANGYHSKTIAYSIWHIFRIEDIVANSLIRDKQEVLDDFVDAIASPLITTGNELVGEQIVDFSKALDVDALYAYALAVKTSTDDLLVSFRYGDLKRTFNDTDKERLRSLGVVSEDENACWLIDYWCDKNIRGLIQMPFSRHWIMHVEASKRIENKIICKKKGSGNAGDINV